MQWLLNGDTSTSLFFFVMNARKNINQVFLNIIEKCYWWNCYRAWMLNIFEDMLGMYHGDRETMAIEYLSNKIFWLPDQLLLRNMRTC